VKVLEKNNTFAARSLKYYLTKSGGVSPESLGGYERNLQIEILYDEIFWVTH
jgi:hypothetical protein